MRFGLPTHTSRFISEDFDNTNLDSSIPSFKANTGLLTEDDISYIDTNKNGTVTIAEAKAAGFSMPIKSDHWLYKYMIDADNDGMVGE